MSADISEWTDPGDDYVSVAVEIFSLLADATRFRIVLALREGELAVGEIAERVSKPQATVSQHLAKLRMSRVVTTRHEGARVYYRLSNDHALELIRVAVFQAEHAVDDTVRHSHHTVGVN
ncbi:MAG: ArsR/SmtB family transcription factor [Rhodoglobus sp.]